MLFKACQAIQISRLPCLMDTANLFPMKNFSNNCIDNGKNKDDRTNCSKRKCFKDIVSENFVPISFSAFSFFQYST